MESDFLGLATVERGGLKPWGSMPGALDSSIFAFLTLGQEAGVGEKDKILLLLHLCVLCPLPSSRSHRG